MGLFGVVALDYYTPSHLMMLAFAPAMFCAMYFALKNKNETIRRRVLMIVFAANGILFLSYKIFMWATFDDFVLLNELPLHLCNFSVILLPVALGTRNKFLYSYMYFVGTLGAFAGVMFFDTFFLGRSVFNYATFVYFFYHSVLLASAATIPALGIYNPKLSDIAKAFGTLAAIVLAMHLVNTLFRITGACEIANYFYTYGLPGNPILGTLYDIIPVPVLYMAPILPVAAALDILLYLPFHKRSAMLKRQSAQLKDIPHNS